MERQNLMNLDTSYKNPFSDYHANQIDVQSLLEYWCDPFSIFAKSGLSETDVYQESGPLVFMGGRGSGKTMFLRQCSIDVQCERFKQLKGNNKSFIEYINKLGGLGIYVRFDGAALKSFEGSNLTEEVWRNLFIHYFELYMAREILTALKIVDDTEDLSNSKSLTTFFNQISKLLGCSRNLNSFQGVIDETTSRLNEVTDFRALVGFQPGSFKPTKPFISQSLCYKIPKIAKNCFSKFTQRTNFLLLIDEYENFSPQQQQVINTLLKFVYPGLTFRIGMRRNGWRTFATVNNDDFVKEGRDYRKYVFEEILHSKSSGYQVFLKEIAQKRLECIPVLKEKGFTDITYFLGEKEDLEVEALKIVDGKPQRIDHFFKSKFPSLKNVKLKSNNNPLLRVLAFIWIIRGENPETTQNAVYELENFDKKKRSKLANKLQYDLVNKYRLSLTIILASIYRTHKQYYSFNTFSYLSSGIVGHFIELCRYAFRYAEFDSNTQFVGEPIPIYLQAKAAREVAFDEIQQIKRIEKHGVRLYRLAENLGSIFRKYHLDLKIRYPETNQFSLDESDFEGESKDAFDAALMWSVIQKKPKLQQSVPGTKKTEIYILNRIFSPIFDISYRTRGGINEIYDHDKFLELINKNDVQPHRTLDSNRLEVLQTSLEL
ncbi:MAG: hypothetical protein AB2552_05905 [Candidatus Thiodiazotropha endolucinida]